MVTPKERLLAAASIVCLVSVFALTRPATIQGDPIKDMRVVNSSAEPIPTTVQGTIAVGGAVQAQQSGAWNVGLLGSPVFRIDPTQNVVRLDAASGGTQLLLNDDFTGIPTGEDTFIVPLDITPFAKIRVSGTINGIGEITFRLYSGPVVGGPNTGLKALDAFSTDSSFTRVYEVAGVALHLSMRPENTNNQAILTVYGH